MTINKLKKHWKTVVQNCKAETKLENLFGRKKKSNAITNVTWDNNVSENNNDNHGMIWKEQKC